MREPAAFGARAAIVRVLIGDDDPQLCELVQRLLRSKGLQADGAQRGLALLSLMSEAPPDLLIVDALLPEIGGIELLEKIAGNPRFGHTAVIVTSELLRDWRMAADLREVYGVAALLEKPFTLNRLWQLVEREAARRAGRTMAKRRLPERAYRAARSALERARAGDLDGAIEACRAGIRDDPQAVQLRLELGALLLRRGAGIPAVIAFEEALKIDPTCFPAMRTLAALYEERGWRHRATDLWQRALAHCPDDALGARMRKHLLDLL